MPKCLLNLESSQFSTPATSHTSTSFAMAIFYIDNRWARLCTSILWMLNLYMHVSRDEAAVLNPLALGFHILASVWSLGIMLRMVYDVLRVIHYTGLITILKIVWSALMSMRWENAHILVSDLFKLDTPFYAGAHFIVGIVYCACMLYMNLADLKVLRDTGLHHTWPPFWAQSFHNSIRATAWICGTVVGGFIIYVYTLCTIALLPIFFPVGRGLLPRPDHMRADIRGLRRLRHLRVLRKN
ncbi:hypothetical protein BDZ45DRAFT_749832 [Acephala macrosclerotiorum]|nr:hypothetical protein BDZ45DRAFT_749832 [Acephala macrosclerotiorum]